MSTQAALFSAAEPLSGAVFSPDATRRFLLWRTWDTSLYRMLYAMLNPSTAGAEEDEERRELLCFGTTARGEPRHPLMLPNSAQLEPWVGPL